MRYLSFLVAIALILYIWMIWALVDTIRKRKKLWFGTVVVCIAFFIFSFIGMFDYYADFITQETATVTGECIEIYIRKPGYRHLGYSKVTFEDKSAIAGRKIETECMSPPKDLELGKIYEVEYYKNSHVIKKCKLVE